MTKNPRTITTYLIDGTPNGLRTLSISNKTCKSLIIPRSAIEKIKDRKEISQPSLYFLLNDDENQIYIGESENFTKRIKDHERKKDFWSLAITFHSQTNDLTKADVKYLEYLSVNATKKIS
ncbi:GIY-YIG nuclease family protein, partial [Flavobacteriaceae bacterium]|nr:GIY-YIG nuclease family protein [Flavobacteriaceae bacterium]